MTRGVGPSLVRLADSTIPSLLPYLVTRPSAQSPAHHRRSEAVVPSGSLGPADLRRPVRFDSGSSMPRPGLSGVNVRSER